MSHEIGYFSHMSTQTDEEPKRPRGRPSTYTQAIADEICERLAKGETLRSVCRTDHMPDESTVRGWLVSNMGDFFPQYTRARDSGLDAMADELFDISDDGSNDYMDKMLNNGEIIEVVNAEHIQRSRLRVETRKWYLSKLAPKRYGDSTTIRGDKDNPLDIGLAALLDAAKDRRGTVPAIENSAPPMALELPAIDIEQTAE